MKEWLQQVRRALMRRKTAYKLTFRGPVAEEVLRDLARFCRANESTFHDNDRVQSKLDGRREVWLRIQHHLQLTPDELWEFYSGRPAQED